METGTPLKRAVPSIWPPAGTYGVVKTRGLVPWIIRRATHGWADHAFVVVDNAGGIVEAEPGGARKGHLAEYFGCRIAVNSAEDTTVQQRAIVAAAALRTVGVPYNNLGIVDDGIEALGWHWRWLTSRAAGDHELICSQLVAQCGHEAGLDWRCGRAGYSEVTPADLARRFGMQPWPGR